MEDGSWKLEVFSTVLFLWVCPSPKLFQQHRVATSTASPRASAVRLGLSKPTPGFPLPSLTRFDNQNLEVPALNCDLGVICVKKFPLFEWRQEQ